MSPCSGSSTLTLEVLDRVVKHQRSRGQLQLQALIQTMLEDTRFSFYYQIFDLMLEESLRNVFQDQSFQVATPIFTGVQSKFGLLFPKFSH